MDEEIWNQLRSQMRTDQVKSGALSNGASMYKTNPNTYNTIPNPATQQYSIAEVQLTNGEMVGMMISASPTLGAHLTKEMSNTGFLYIYNETESLIIKADRVAAVKLTKFTQE